MEPAAPSGPRPDGTVDGESRAGGLLFRWDAIRAKMRSSSRWMAPGKRRDMVRVQSQRQREFDGDCNPLQLQGDMAQMVCGE